MIVYLHDQVLEDGRDINPYTARFLFQLSDIEILHELKVLDLLLQIVVLPLYFLAELDQLEQELFGLMLVLSRRLEFGIDHCKVITEGIECRLELLDLSLLLGICLQDLVD